MATPIRRPGITRVVTVIGGLLAQGCSSATSPTVDTVAGSYAATTFEAVDGGQVVDILGQGGTLAIVLQVDLSTTGRLFVPDGGETGEDLDVDLTGTWMLSADTIRFDHSADTFVRDMVFLVEGTRLTGEETFGSTVVRVTLSR
jgi:hypothetical protein